MEWRFIKKTDALEINNIINNLNQILMKKSENINKEFYKADKFLIWKQINALTFKSYPQAYHISCLLDFIKQLNETLNQKENIKTEYSGKFYFLNKVLYLKVL